MSQKKSQPGDEIQFLLPGIHVNHSHKLGSASARKMTATSGRTSARLLHKNDPLGAFSKMFMVMSPWVSTKCYLTWKPMATPQGHLLFRLVVSMPRTDEIGSGSSGDLWATPNTMDSLPSRSYEAMLRQATNGGRKNRKRPSNLREQIDPLMVQAYEEARAKANKVSFERKLDPQMWATPRASDGTGGPRQLDEQGRRISKTNPDLKFGANLADQARMWPTPRAFMHKDSTTDRGKGNLGEKVGGPLNPQWVEWLMGYPEGWTDLKD